MGENRSSSSRLSLRNNAAAAVGGGGGEIVEVQGGGHIMRSTGRKDRHSKVCTAKGPRDRRVRLAAHTAIQFYDVQDRLGYDRPSKAVDWLIKKAKPAIDELAELPAWKPNTGSTPTQEKPPQQDNLAGPSSKIENEASFLPPSLDSDSIADTIKSFFPMGASEEANNSNLQFQSFTQQPDLLSRTGSHSQDLRLSLQSFQDPSILLHHQNQQNPNPVSHRAILTGFDASAWPEQNQQRYDTTTGGYMFNSPHQQQQQQQPLFQQLFGGQNQFFSSQRGPLQSSYSPSIRAWMDPSSSSSAIAIASLDPNQHQHQHYQSAMLPIYNYPSSLSGVGEFSGFRIPARIQGEEEEEHDGISDKPSSASSDSRR